MPTSPQRLILERRRLRGWQLYQRGWKSADIARALGVSVNAVCTWIRRGIEGGEQALKARPTPGGPTRISARHRMMLMALLGDTPTAYGFNHDAWTIHDVQHMIKRLFGVVYSPQHVGRLLRAAKTTGDLLPPMLQIELQDLLAKGNVMVVRRRIRRSKQSNASSTRSKHQPRTL
jgi:transposase